MKPALFLSTLVVIWIQSCAIYPAKTTIKRDWPEIISYLNHDENPHALYGAELDLLKIYRDEVNSIAAVDKTLSVREKNQYIHREIKKLNDEDINMLLRDKDSAQDYRKVLDTTLRVMESSNTASTKNVSSYDDGEQIGFCFARALYGHYLLRKAGVSQKHIFKLFALSDLKVGAQFWHFHVALLVRDKNGLLVLDPLFKEVTNWEDWRRNLENLDVKSPNARVRFYVSDPRKLRPESGVYDLALLSNPHVKLYFDNLLKEL